MKGFEYCPACGEEMDSIESFGFRNCKVRFDGVREDGEVFQREVDYDSRQYYSSEQLMTSHWRGLEANVSPIYPVSL
jgi:hypothetical protein